MELGVEATRQPAYFTADLPAGGREAEGAKKKDRTATTFLPVGRRDDATNARRDIFTADLPAAGRDSEGAERSS